MILKIKSYFYQIYKIIFLLLLASISNLYAHNSFNGGCEEDCGQKVKVISNKNKLKNIDDQINIPFYLSFSNNTYHLNRIKFISKFIRCKYED